MEDLRGHLPCMLIKQVVLTIYVPLNLDVHVAQLSPLVVIHAGKDSKQAFEMEDLRGHLPCMKLKTRPILPEGQHLVTLAILNLKGPTESCW
jgi:hypothetical protein